MSTKITTKWINDNAITGAKIRLANNEQLKARNAANNGDVNILKVSADNSVQMASFFKTPIGAPVLSYDVANRMFVEDAITSAVAAISVADLSDVVITSVQTGQVLKWNGSGWVNSTDLGGGAEALDELSDVVLSGNTTGNMLVYNGSEWVNSGNIANFALSSDIVDKVVQYITVNATISSVMRTNLSSTPRVANEVTLEVVGGMVQEYSEDYVVSGNVLIWDASHASVGAGMSDDITSGDKFRVIYEA